MSLVSILNSVYTVDCEVAVNAIDQNYAGPCPVLSSKLLVEWLVTNPHATSIPPPPHLTVEGGDSIDVVANDQWMEVYAAQSRQQCGYSGGNMRFMPIGPMPEEILRARDPTSLLYLGETTTVDDEDYTFQMFAKSYIGIFGSPISPGNEAAKLSKFLNEAKDELVRLVADEDVEYDAVVSLNTVLVLAADALSTHFKEVGYKVFISLLYHCSGLTTQIKFAECVHVTDAQIRAYKDLLTRYKIQKADCVAFYKANCGSVLQTVRQNFINDMRQSVVVSCDKHTVTNSESVYNFSSLAFFVHSVKVPPPRLEGKLTTLSMSKLAFDARKLTRVGKVVLSVVDQYAMYCAIWVAAEVVEDQRVFVFKGAALDTGLKEKIVNHDITVRLRSIAALPDEFYKASKEMQVSYLVRAMSEGDLDIMSPYLNVGSLRFNPYNLYLDVVSVKDEKHAEMLALERARLFRAGTVMDGLCASAYLYLQLSSDQDNPRFVKYSPELARALHICAYLRRIQCKHVLWVIQPSEFNTIVDKLVQFSEKYSIECKVSFSTLSIPDGVNTVMNKNVLLSHANSMDWLKRNNGVLVWLQNPKNNDYLTFSQPTDTISVTYSNYVASAQRVVKLIGWGHRENYLHGLREGDNLEILRSDVKMPYSTYYAEEVPASGGGKVFVAKSLPGQDHVVPIGHAPHTAQRIITYVVGSHKSVLVGAPHGAERLNRYQVYETIAMSQRRDRMIACYSSAEIQELNLIGAFLQKDVVDVVSDVFDY